MANSVKRTPLYKQIEMYIYDHMRNNNWEEHHKLPSETELAEQFNVSRLTVKNAMQNLIDKGLIYRIQGKGSFISDQKGEPLLYESGPAEAKEKLIAYIVPLAKTMHALQMINGIEEQLTKQGYRLLLFKTYNSKEVEKQVLQEAIRYNVAGIIIYPVEGETYSEEILKLSLSSFPLVIVDRYLRGIETNCVYASNTKGAYDAVSHLLQSGHKKIGFVSTQINGTSSIEDRLAGYELALAEHNAPIEHRLRRTHFHLDQVNNIISTGSIEASVKHELQEFIGQNPDMTAIFAVNSPLGITVMEAASDMGIRVPEQLSVCFFDDFMFSDYSRIPPTCVDQQAYLIGQAAAKLIAAVIEDPNLERRKIEIPTILKVRSSTALCETKMNCAEC